MPCPSNIQTAVAGEVLLTVLAVFKSKKSFASKCQIGSNAGRVDRALTQVQSAVGDSGAATELLEQLLAVGQGVERLRFTGSFAQDDFGWLEADRVGVCQVVREDVHAVLSTRNAVLH